MEYLAECRIAVFGIGGVGGYVCEALARSGVGAFDLIDDDKVCLTNINRQIIATRKTVGRYKADVMKERILDINQLGFPANTSRCSPANPPASTAVAANAMIKEIYGWLLIRPVCFNRIMGMRCRI